MISAMSRPVRVLTEQRSVGRPDALLPNAGTEEIKKGLFGEAEETSTAQEEVTTDSGRKLRGSGKRTDRNSGLHLVPDLDFRPDRQPTLKEFFDQGPKNDIETALLLVFYMQRFMKLTKISPAHVMTQSRMLERSRFS